MRLDRLMQAYILVASVVASLAGLTGARNGLLGSTLIAAAPLVTVFAASVKYSKLYLIPGILLLAFWLYALEGLLG